MKTNNISFGITNANAKCKSLDMVSSPGRIMIQVQWYILEPHRNFKCQGDPVSHVGGGTAYTDLLAVDFAAPLDCAVFVLDFTAPFDCAVFVLGSAGCRNHGQNSRNKNASEQVNTNHNLSPSNDDHTLCIKREKQIVSAYLTSSRCFLLFCSIFII